ncbi:hypothetical protein QBC39DRAFT_313109 [Podospora conica]|nr:hypothetical protein QBC39DRAFT_313109 [Schizothecium conicum]
MPPRYPPTRALGALLRRTSPVTHHRPFHTTPGLLHDDPPSSSENQTHYETLQIPPDAPLSDVKKSFFALSKRHHPDHNPSDPHAPRRFMRLSEAYAVLGHADKRARYDRDVMRHLHPTPVPHRHGHGSYHSSNPAGGRAPSGLSRRRATFHGPPPSFYRSGGWGAHGAKRKAAHDESTGGAEARAGEAAEGGMGPGQNPWRARNDHDRDVPHWDREAHERTQRRHDERRARRMASRVRSQAEENPFVSFFIVSGVLAAGVLGPYILIGMWIADN